jgi:acyl carrier protein
MDMNMASITFDTIAEHLAQILQVPKERLRPESVISEIGTDSLALVELYVDLQEEIDVIITQEELAGLRTLGDLVSLLRERQHQDLQSGHDGSRI